MIQPHIQLDEALHVKYAILPGDPARVDRIAKFMDHPQELAFNREYKSVRGTYKGVSVVALSTGIGEREEILVALEAFVKQENR